MTDSPAQLESIVQFADEVLGVSGFPDYPGAQNGLQVQGTRGVLRVGAAVDASVATIRAAVDRDVDLLIVHHGLYWDGLRPLTGRRFDRVAPLIQAGMGLYSAHLPLDAHPEIGNAILLARAMGLESTGRFGVYQGVEIGAAAAADTDRERLRAMLESAVDGPTRLIPAGPERVTRIAVVTGSGAGFLEQAADEGYDALVTGEAAHHTYLDAMEYGVNLLLGGHYATETFGVRALASRMSDRFGVEAHFLDFPTGI